MCEGKAGENFREVDLNGLLEEVAQWERWYAGEEGAERIRTELRAERATVRGNEAALESVFQNLIGNAMKYAGDEAVVTVRSDNAGKGRVRVEVVDNGRGIGGEERKRIFRRGYRGTSYDGKPTGKGMGLYIARRVVRRHGGTIGVESEPGKGCRFWIVLPLI